MFDPAFRLLERFTFVLGLGALALALPRIAQAQIDEDELGAWYMYAWSAALDDRSFGFQGDVQYRNWDRLGDLEQLLIRGGVTINPQGARHTFTFGVAHVTSGEFGSSSATSRESRLYQELLIPQTIGHKLYVTHRFRYEQRWVDGQDLRTRLRYFLGLNFPLNRDSLGDGAIYLSFYNELFANLEKNIGDGRRVDAFDRNRAYLALGYALSDDLRLQFGFMSQKTKTLRKQQLQFNVIQRF
jgi:hypothetical protein